MRACCGVRLPLRRLQGEHAATTFSQVVWPPLLRGMMWSKVRSSSAEQYWQTKRSRRNTLNRVKAGCVVGLTKDRSEEHTSELQSPDHLVCRLLLEKKKLT